MNNKVSFQQAIKAGALSAATAALINSILFFIFREAGILPDTVFVQPGQPLTVMSVIISSSIPLLLASIVFFYWKNTPVTALNYLPPFPWYWVPFR